VRRRGPPKQRLWLGARQCCSGCRNATTNTTATNAYAYSDGDAMRAWNTYAYTDYDSDRNTNRDTYRYANADASIANTYSHDTGNT
jgi:hypothetical protein